MSSLPFSYRCAGCGATAIPSRHAIPHTCPGLGAELNAKVAAVDGRSFVVTPFIPEDALGSAIGLGSGRLWVKDETGNVAGSHKKRPLAGIMLPLLGGGRR